jgi:hypothetical protein
MNADYTLVLIIWATIVTAIIGIRPVLSAVLWYYEQRLDQETRRKQMLVDQTTNLEAALKVTDLVNKRFGNTTNVTNPQESSIPEKETKT